MLWRIWQLIRAVARSVVLAGTIVGVLYLWPDLQGLPEVYGFEWGQVMPDRETVAFALLGLALAWIVWIDARPVVKRWLADTRGQQAQPYFILTGQIYCESVPVIRKSDGQRTRFFANLFYIRVGNGLESGQTLKRVRATTCYFDEPVIAPVKGTEAGQIDIRHGEWAFFELGRIVSEHPMGRFRPTPEVTVGNDSLQAYAHNIANGVLVFEVHSSTGVQEYWIFDQPEQPRILSFPLTVSADDALALSVRIHIDLRDTKSPVSYETVS